jgi:hypothetical protein
VVPEIGTAAASSKLRAAGFRASFFTGTTANSANEPDEANPITSSPGANPATADPTAWTTPATSPPRTRVFGLRSPRNSRAKYGFPSMTCHTSGPEPAACTRTSTSFSPTFGTSMSRNSSTSTDPYLS